MKDYEVTFVDNKIGRSHDAPPVVFEKVEDHDQLRARITKHAHKHLMSQSVSVDLNGVARHGRIYAGMRCVGEFDWTVTRLHERKRHDFERADHHHGEDLSPDRPCDWILGGGGVCRKPSANVRWTTAVRSSRRWHCPEHTPDGEKIGWERVIEHDEVHA